MEDVEIKLTGEQWSKVFAINCVHGRNLSSDFEECKQLTVRLLAENLLTWEQITGKVKEFIRGKYEG